MFNHSAGTEMEDVADFRVEAHLVATVVQQVWSSMLGMSVESASRSAPEDSDRWALLGSVHFGGVWQGMVLLNCSATLARTMAGGMFGAEPSSLTTEEVHDAVGELVNIIGGNLKHLLPKPCHLSLPSVRESRHPDKALAAGKAVTEVGFVCENEPFRVALVETRPGPMTKKT